MSGHGEITLGKEMFQAKERTLVKWQEMKASSFLYESGVHGIRIENDLGHIVVLPYLGQQIWDAVFHNRSLKMVSKFSEPQDVSLIAHTYGPFLYHCGALRMGNPGPEDTHPVHGELPCARFDSAWILAGEDENGIFLGVSGRYRYHDAFASHYYQACPAVRIYLGSSLIDVSMTIENFSEYPMELMYMSHVNFRPVDGARIVQAVPWTREHIVLRDNMATHSKDIQQSEAYLRFMKTIRNNPEYSSLFRPEDPYMPEVVLYLNFPRVDERGWTHFLQLHPDGSGDYITYQPRELDHATRWIVRNKDREAFGLLLPATCDPEGYTHEKVAGNIKTIPPRDSLSFHVQTGALNPTQASAMKKMIESLVD